MRVWITKYALTWGIKVEEVEEYDPETIGIRPKSGTGLPRFYHGEGKEWHRTKLEALQKAEEMRRGKIESLKKQITKLEALRFD